MAKLVQSVALLMEYSRTLACHPALAATVTYFDAI